MPNYVIVGTSGVGKSYLEQVLQEKYGFSALPKITDRVLRPGEGLKGEIVSISTEEFLKEKENDEYVFTLDYKGFHYAWRKSDFERLKLDQKNITIAITLESLEGFLNSTKEFIPIYLKVSKDNLELLKFRMLSRGTTADEVIQRMKLAESELEKFGEDYEKMVANNGGKVFEIEDDTTLFEKVIPWIMEKNIFAEKIQVVDDQGNPTGRFEIRKDIHTQKLLHASVHLWVVNSKNELLLTKRSMHKSNFPGDFHISLAGHITGGDDSLNTILREAEEELGLDVNENEAKKLDYDYYPVIEDGEIKDNEFLHVYFVRKDLDITKLELDPMEVEKCFWMDIYEFEKKIQEEEFYSGFLKQSREYYLGICRRIIEKLG